MPYIMHLGEYLFIVIEIVIRCEVAVNTIMNNACCPISVCDKKW